MEGGFVRAEGDLLHIAVVERHRGARSVGRAFVRGFGPLEGAVASSVAHDHHNVVVAGSDPGDMLTAVRRLAQIGGGFVAVSGGSVLGELRLPLAGLLSLDPVEEVASSLRRLRDAVRGMGCALEKPFMQLSFVTLPTVPELGLTNRGLVDARRFEIVDPVVEFR
ncbi:MAG: hypothetical protein DRO06_03245 [Thermoproteota archaeon]|nr:MAG: hypothetical protein DRO06_03245 [Candidatus Korarchaeota archaeon]